MKCCLLCVIFLLDPFIVLAADVPAFRRVAPVAPADAPKTLHALDGFRMDLLAAEPLVTSPVAMTYDENGVAYVVEMVDYPYTDKATHQPYKENTADKSIGHIRMLESTRGDGVFDKSFIFAEGLSWPTGIACYKGGVSVIATPDLWYLKSTHGDHKADIRRKVFTGFRKFNIQAVANNLAWGLDNKIYGAGGSNGGTILTVDNPEFKPVPLSRNDFRFNPATEVFEPIPGGARFGNTFDDWGNRFVCNIRNPAQHVVFESHYLSRNPYLPVASAINDVAESGDAIPVYRASPLEEWRDLRGRRWSTDGTIMPRSKLVAGGVVTSSSGVTLYRGADWAMASSAAA
jgi:putative membrane-bound dehydrogenase-like protein